MPSPTARPRAAHENEPRRARKRATSRLTTRRATDSRKTLTSKRRPATGVARKRSPRPAGVTAARAKPAVAHQAAVGEVHLRVGDEGHVRGVAVDARRAE